MTFRQKVIKIGNSKGITIPAQFDIAVGTTVSVYIDEKKDKISIHQNQLPPVSKELVDWTEKFIEQYRPALEKLAQE